MGVSISEKSLGIFWLFPSTALRGQPVRLHTSTPLRQTTRIAVHMFANRVYLY